MLSALFEKFQIESKPLSLKHGEEVFQIGHQSQFIYQVSTGQVQLYRDDLNGNCIILHQAFSGHFFAEASINSEQYHCTAQCIGDTTLQKINIQSFRNLLQTNAEFSTAWINHLSTELRRQRASVERLSLKTAVEKITHFISTEGNADGSYTLNGSLTEVAQIIGLSRESLYRTLAKMKKNGQIEQKTHSLQLL